MSLILEALKKSEAERQLGRAPGLMTPMPAFASRRSRVPFWIALAIVVLGSVVTAAWWFSRSAPDAAPEISGVEIERAVPSTASAVAQHEAQPRDTTPARSDTPVTASKTTAGACSPAPTVASPPPALRPQAADVDMDLPAPRDPAFDSVERESMPVTPEILSPAPPPILPSPVQVETVPVVDTAPAATDVGDPLGIAVADLPKMDQLSAQERENLPPLKMSMHLFAEDPAARFVLIDGQRYAGGEQIASSLRVVAIRRDGAELEFNGRHFLLPRP